MNVLEINNVIKRFGNLVAVGGVSRRDCVTGSELTRLT